MALQRTMIDETRGGSVTVNKFVLIINQQYSDQLPAQLPELEIDLQHSSIIALPSLVFATPFPSPLVFSLPLVEGQSYFT